MSKLLLSAVLRVTLAVSMLLLQMPVPAAEQFSGCKPTESAVFADRIHVRCETAVDGRFQFFASPTSDPRQANRFLALMVGAELGDKYLNVLFDPTDAGGATFGCLANNCRRIVALAIMERVPGRCEIDNTQRKCPGFCDAVGGNDPDCPGYCSSHDDMRCAGNCQRHPTNPECIPEPPDPCSGPQAPHLPQCPKH